MPCYLFTYHGYGTWMPDRPQGYVHRTNGLQPRNQAMAEKYRQRQREPVVAFTPQMQALLVETARAAGGFIAATVHAVATDPTHVHVLVSWRDEGRTWKSARASIRSAMSRKLNETYERRTWFADTPSRKQVKDRAHFDHLVTTYLPKHRGVVWFERRI